MDIKKTGSIGTEQAWSGANQKAAQKVEQDARETAAQGTKIPEGGESGAAGGAAVKGETPQGTEREAAALKQAQAAAASGSQAAQSTAKDEDAAYQAIVKKADSGQALTGSELNQLRAKDPARYSKAMKAMEARQNLRKQMESDPSHAKKAADEAVAAVKTQAADDVGALRSAHGAMDASAAMVGALNDEYNTFARQYDQVMFDNNAFALEE